MRVIFVSLFSAFSPFFDTQMTHAMTHTFVRKLPSQEWNNISHLRLNKSVKRGRLVLSYCIRDTFLPHQTTHTFPNILPLRRHTLSVFSATRNYNGPVEEAVTEKRWKNNFKRASWFLPLFFTFNCNRRMPQSISGWKHFFVRNGMFLDALFHHLTKCCDMNIVKRKNSKGIRPISTLNMAEKLEDVRLQGYLFIIFY